MSSVAACATCGAPIPIAGLEPARCAHCGGEPLLDPATCARLDAHRRRIATSARSAQQLDGALAKFGEGVGAFEIVSGALLWGFIGGLLTWGAAGNLEEGQGFFDVLVDPPAYSDASFAAATFWMAFLTLLGFTTSCVLAGLARLVARRQVRFAFPAPPAYPGGPPSCRVCGGDLPARGVVRRCRYCAADNVVDGVHFQHVDDDLAARLRARERAVEANLASRQRMVARFEKLVMGPPFIVLVAFPLVFWLGQPTAAAWLVPAGLATTAALLFVAAALVPAPRARARGAKLGKSS